MSARFFSAPFDSRRFCTTSLGAVFLLTVGSESWPQEDVDSAAVIGWYQRFDFPAGKLPHEVTHGEIERRFEPLDQLIRSFIERHQIPGASVAVIEHQELVFARGYGYADIEEDHQVQPTHLFRIASISKPITACAILQLVECGRLKLDSPILEVLNLETEVEQVGKKFDVRWRDVTISHLLCHTGGWDIAFDPMSQVVAFAAEAGVAPPADPLTIIRAMISHPLDFAPGTKRSYSNFGYCLLGRAIESASGTSYQDYVRKYILTPLEIDTMRLGKTQFKNRSDNEVRYYHVGETRSVFHSDDGALVPLPYGAGSLEASDSHGGWIASATDLVKFASSFDRPEKCPILDYPSVKAMFSSNKSASSKNGALQGPKSYSYGWFNKALDDGKRISWHTGSLPGSSSLLMRLPKGINVAVLFNAVNSEFSSHLARSIKTKLEIHFGLRENHEDAQYRN